MFRLLWWVALAAPPLWSQLPDEGQIGLMLPAPAADRSPAIAKIRSRIARRQFSDAEQQAETLIRDEPSSWEGYFWKGFAAMQQKKLYASVKSLRQAERCKPPGDAVAKVLALTYYLLDQRFLFRMKTEEAMAEEPADFAPYYFLGRYLYSTEYDPPAAAPYFTHALERNPEHAASVYFRGACLEAAGKIEEARAEFLRAIALAEKQKLVFSLPYQGLSRLALHENLKASLVFARKAVELEPRSAEGQLQLAKAAALAGDREVERKALEAAIALDPSRAGPRYQLFQLYQQTGDERAAKDQLAEFRRRVACYGTE